MPLPAPAVSDALTNPQAPPESASIPEPASSAPDPFAGLPKVAPFVDQLILWLIEHPGEPKKRAAEFFRVTPQWMYTITQTDLFKARLQEVVRNIGIKPALADLHAKLAAALEMSVDQVMDHLRTSGDPKYAFEVATRLLAQKQGPAVAIQVNTQNNVTYQVDARTAAVANARRRMLDDASRALEARPVPTAAEILGGPSSGLSFSSSDDRSEETG